MNGKAAAGQDGGGAPSLWQRLLSPTCRCCKTDGEHTVADGDDVPAQIADCDDELNRGLSKSAPKVDGKADSKECVRGDKRRWTDTSLASNTDRKEIGLSLNEFAIVHRAARSLQKAVGVSDEPTARDLDRGVHVENIYDFYDPEVHKVRVRKMDDTVLHTRTTQARHTNMSLAVTLQRLKEEPGAIPDPSMVS
ncbi:unnamed protein product [Durusdinium trenchii]|uniref:Uncharacterized protein n=1 Tax=Durusdinium trenchii TaxID=1381693 RepID=A0ABP0KKB3_9DINO